MENLNKITIITGEGCVYCDKAKNLFQQMMLPYEELDILDIPNAGQYKTVPQIFVNDKRIGGYTDLMVYLNKLLLNTTD